MKTFYRAAISMLLVITFVLPAQIFAQANQHTKKHTGGTPDIYFWEYLPPGYASSGTQTYPLLIFFHGLGERSDPGEDPMAELDSMAMVAGPPKEINQQIATDDGVMCFTVNGVEKCFIVISPQFPAAVDDSWGVRYPEVILTYAMSHYRVDPNQVFLTGLSMGGIATFQYVQSTKTYAESIAAVGPISGKSDVTKACFVAGHEVALWAFHGDQDTGTGTPYANVQQFVNNYNACSPTPVPPARLTTFKNVGHSGTVWNRVYKTDHTYFRPNLYEWFLSNPRGGSNLAPPTVPYVNAGNDVTITLPQNAVTLNGSVSDNDGTSAGYTWSKVSGGSATLSNTNQANLSVTGLTAGTYVFRLSATNDSNITVTDDVTVTVNGSDGGGSGGSWLELTTNSASGKRIELYYDSQKSNAVQLEIGEGSNTNLEFYVKTLSGSPNWASLQAGLTVKYSTMYVNIGSYVATAATNGWHKVSIPLADFNHDPTKWTQGGVSNVGFKIVSNFGTGTIVFGVDEVRFTGSASPYTWYGDAYETSGSAAAVYTQDATSFYISARPVSGGVVLSNARYAVAANDTESTEGINAVHLYDQQGQHLQSIYPADTFSEDDLIEMIPKQGLYLYRIVKSSGAVETKRIMYTKSN